MRVLVACEYSGVVRDAFTKRGHYAKSCDLIPSETEGEHYCGNVLDIINDDWDLMIAHPPCTYLSAAGACRMYPKKGIIEPDRYDKGLLAVEFFKKLWKAPIPKICIENPVSLRIFANLMPYWTQYVEPYDFGHPYTKKTRLWLKNLPDLEATETVLPTSPFCPSGTGRKIKEKYGAAIRGNDSKNRSRTFTGIADAMAEQWGGLPLFEGTSV